MRFRIGVATVIVALGVATGLALAQQPVPTVTVNASATAITVDAAAPIAAGPTRLNFVTPVGKKALNVYVGLLVPGVSIDELAQTLAREDGRDASSALGLISIQASAVLTPGETEHGVTFTVKPGLTYVVIADEDFAGKRPVPRAFTTFTSSGDANGAVAPAPDATVTMQGLRFKGASVLPRNGVVRFKNGDGVSHIAIAFPLRKGTTNAQLGRGLRGSEKAFGKLLAGEPYTAQTVLSGGNTSDDQEVRFPKAGRYGLVCFIDEHFLLGMHKVVTVK